MRILATCWVCLAGIAERLVGDGLRLWAEAALTTPNAVEMQRRIANLRDNKITRLALEVSSHALAQSRIDDVQIDVAVFTNLTRDHLDFHKNHGGLRQGKVSAVYPLAAKACGYKWRR